MMASCFLQVDIFLPRYKEPWSLYGPVVQTALDINYPADKLTVYVLDDGRSNPVKHSLTVRTRRRKRVLMPPHNIQVLAVD